MSVRKQGAIGLDSAVSCPTNVSRITHVFNSGLGKKILPYQYWNEWLSVDAVPIDFPAIFENRSYSK